MDERETIQRILDTAAPIFGEDLTRDYGLLVALVGTGNGFQWMLLVRDPTAGERASYMPTFGADTLEMLLGQVEECKLQRVSAPHARPPTHEWLNNFTQFSDN